MSYLFEPASPRTSGQRLHQLLVVLGFVALVALGPVVFIAAEPARTRASIPAPDWTWQDFRAGNFTGGLGKHLTEASPVTVQGRGVYNETLYRLGRLQSARVQIGRRGWLFLRESVTVHPNFAAGRGVRTGFLTWVQATAKRLGVEVLVVVVPSKVRVYADHLFPGGALPAARAALYDQVLAELAAAGLTAVDVLRPLQAARQQRPHELLYFRRDTHWAPPGAWLAARLCRQRLQQLGWLDRAGPLQEFRAMQKQKLVGESDLVGLLGLRPGSALSVELREAHDFMGFQLANGDEYPDLHPDAAVALAGTSFSFGGLSRALPHELVRLVDCRGVIAGGGLMRGLISTFERIERGELPNCKIVVWEIVEHVFAEQWAPE